MTSERFSLFPRKISAYPASLFRSGTVDVEVGQVPVFNQVAKRHNGRETVQIGPIL